jgi:hypothetical protein
MEDLDVVEVALSVLARKLRGELGVDAGAAGGLRRRAT